MKKGELYSFEQLEKHIIDSDYVALVVLNIEVKEKAIMHVFSTNFSKEYQSGDGVLFYADGEVHSANPADIFQLIDIITI